MYCGFSGRVTVVESLGSSGSHGSASYSSSLSPCATSLGGWEWLSMALILLISARSWGSAFWARSAPATNTEQSRTTAVLAMGGMSLERSRKRVNPGAKDCKKDLTIKNTKKSKAACAGIDPEASCAFVSFVVYWFVLGTGQRCPS